MDHQPGMHGMDGAVTLLETAGAVLFVLWTVAMWGAVVVIALADRGPARPWLYRSAVGVVVLGVLGQIGHFQEHVAQAGYWVANPMQPAWMTPLGDGLARGLGQVAPSNPNLGMELLHLKGNLVFLAGLVGIMLLTRRVAGDLTSRRWARMGVWMQGIHGVEHVVLTVSVALGASGAIGLSTWFGTIEPGPALTTYRVWWHFVANLVGTAILAMALYHLWRERRLVERSYEPPRVSSVLQTWRADRSPATAVAGAARAASPADAEPTDEAERTGPAARTHRAGHARADRGERKPADRRAGARSD